MEDEQWVQDKHSILLVCKTQVSTDGILKFRNISKSLCFLDVVSPNMRFFLPDEERVRRSLSSTRIQIMYRIWHKN